MVFVSFATQAPVWHSILISISLSKSLSFSSPHLSPFFLSTFVAIGTCHHSFFGWKSTVIKVGHEYILVVCKWEIFKKMPFLMNPLVLSWFKKKNDATVELSFIPSTSDPSVQIMFIFQFTGKKRNVKIFHWKLTALTNFKG